MLQRILPLTDDKVYLRSLAKNEAKALPSLLKAWAKLQDAFAPAHAGSNTRRIENDLGPGVVEADILSVCETAPIVLLRLVNYSLLRTKHDGLDLSALGVRPSSIAAIDMKRLCAVLGISVEEVEKLNLSQNGWKRELSKHSLARKTYVVLELRREQASQCGLISLLTSCIP